MELTAAQHREIADLMEKIEAIKAGGTATKATKAPAAKKGKGKRKMTEAAKKKIGDAQRKRWATFHAEQKKKGK
jgi:hypothetical protein